MPPSAPTPSNISSRLDRLEVLIAEQIPRLQISVDKLTESVSEFVRYQGIHNVEQKQLEERVMRMHISLYGENGDNGYIKRVQDVETIVKETTRRIEKAFWIVVTPILSLVGIAIILMIADYIIKHGGG